MSQLILTAHTGIHDAGAALFEDYNLLAAVSARAADTAERNHNAQVDGFDRVAELRSCPFSVMVPIHSEARHQVNIFEE